MAAKAKDGITFIGEIDGYPVIGQFTTVRFEENDELIAVINDSPVDGRYYLKNWVLKILQSKIFIMIF